jgi:hypothetical protein
LVLCICNVFFLNIYIKNKRKVFFFYNKYRKLLCAFFEEKKIERKEK